jgi:hypothetical protein
MSLFEYTNDIPNRPDNPSNNQPDMKQNTNSISALLAVDHLGFNVNQGGNHNVIHFFTQTNDPGLTSPPVGQEYTKSVTPDTSGGLSDTQLFFESALGVIAQLTGSSTSNSTDGYAYLGGIIIQWGLVTTGSSSGSVTFKNRVTGAIPFPNNCFVVVPGLASGSALIAGSNVSIRNSTVSKTGFNWLLNNVGGVNGFFWIAIGN